MPADYPPEYDWDIICDLCGLHVDGLSPYCQCPPCPLCGVIGRIPCLWEHGLWVPSEEEIRQEYNQAHRLSPDDVGYLDAQYSLRNHAEVLKWVYEQRDKPDYD